MTSLSLTIAGSGPVHDGSLGGRSFLTDGVKIGDVGRITAGTYTGTARDINLLVTGVTATVLTVLSQRLDADARRGPLPPRPSPSSARSRSFRSTGHTNDYYTFEEWFNDITQEPHLRRHADRDRPRSAFRRPATRRSSWRLLGLSRTKGSSQVLTSPTAETTTSILTAANAMILLNGSRTLVGTSLSIKIDGQLQYGDAVIGSNSLSDVTKGDVKVSGSVTVQFDGETVSSLFDNETALDHRRAVRRTSATADFIGFTIPRVKLMKDDIDDGKKQLVMTCDFTAQINTSGGAALANDQGIISIQDSQAA
jgi:hypothetical protein